MAKKIGIISDTHGLLRPEVLEILKTKLQQRFSIQEIVGRGLSF